MKNIYILFFFLVLSTAVKAQSVQNLEGTLEQLAKYNAQFPREKVYLHIDKPYYSLGDQIWFKAYITVGAYNYLSSLSKILYVELINVEDEIVLSRRLPVIAGITFGDFLLTDSLATGDYRIRAYTNWMRNFDERYFFDRDIKIGNALNESIEDEPDRNNRKKDREKKKLNQETEESDRILIFSDNSKNLVVGTLNKVVYQIKDINHASQPTEGALIDSESKKVLTFNPPPLGIGNFSFYPESGLSYRVQIEFNDGTSEETILPEVTSQGYTLETNTWRPGQIFVRISQPDSTKMDELVLVIQKAGEVFYAVKVRPAGAQTSLSIPKKDLPIGPVELNLFTQSMETIAKKNIFIYNDIRKLPLEIIPNKESYGAREQVNVNLKSGSQDSVRVGSFSVAVIDLNQVPRDSNDLSSIVSYLTLNTETRSPVKSPLHYFPNEDIKKKTELDNLVQTFKPENIWEMLDQQVKFKPEQDLHISGQVTKRNGNPVPRAHVMVMSPGTMLVDTIADENGRFNFNQLLFYDNTSFVVQARDEKGKRNVEILLDEVPRQTVSSHKNASSVDLTVDTSLNHYIKNSKERFDYLLKSGKIGNGILLDDVDIVVEKKNPAENSSNLNGPGNADQVLSGDDLSTCSSLLVCLQGRLTGVIFKQGTPYSTRSPNQPMQVILDGMYMEGDILSSIPPMDVAAIEVLRTPGNLGIYGSMGGGGIIIITTKIGGGNYSSNLYTPGIITFSPQGFYKISEFASPDYSKVEENINEPDLRSTIYWNPNITTDENGEASFDFYTADRKGKYLIIVEGVDLNGRLGYAESYIEITDN